MTGNIERAAWVVAIAVLGSAVLLAWSMRRSAETVAEKIKPAQTHVSNGGFVDGTLTVILDQGSKPLAVAVKQPHPAPDMDKLRNSFVDTVKLREGAGNEVSVEIQGARYNAEADRCFFSGHIERQGSAAIPFAATLEGDGFGSYLGDIRNNGGVVHSGIRVSP